MLAVFLWNCHMQMLYTSLYGPAIQRTRDPNIEANGRGGGGAWGVGGARNGKDRVFVF